MKYFNKILEHQLFISLLILNAVIFILFSPNHFLFELFLSIAFQITLGIAFLMIVFIANKKWIGTSVSLIAIILFYSNVSYLRIADNSIIYSNKNDFKIAHFNVLKFNTKYDKTIQAIM